jgi:hypothetical protein
MSGTAEHGADGRWGGRLTQRPLPAEDTLMEALSERDRERLAQIWLYRSATERRVADSFEVITASLRRRAAPAALIAISARAVDDEYRHTELSRVVASRFAARELVAPPRLPLEAPKHEGASPALRDTLFVVGQCVLNETTASAFLESCLEHARGELARVALRELLSDEIEHGRLGWSYLAWLDEAERAAVGPWLLPMAYLNLKLWREETPADPEHVAVLAEHGAPPAAVIHEALVGALTSLIVPGLRELGMTTAPLEAWLADGAGTERPPREYLSLGV